MKLTDVLKLPEELLQDTLAYVSKLNKQYGRFNHVTQFSCLASQLEYALGKKENPVNM